MTDRLLEIREERQALHARLVALDQEENEILTGTERTGKKPVPLTFGKNVVAWGDRKMPLKGKGYKFVKALYDAKKMRLKGGTLGKRVWGKDKEPQRHTFNVFIRWITEKLEKAKFPYLIKPVMRKGQVRQAEERRGRNNKPIKIYEPPEIIGVKMHVR